LSGIGNEINYAIRGERDEPRAKNKTLRRRLVVA
jgi:hypothetical protein